MAHRAFDVPRALDYALSYGPELERIRSVIKPENAWNIEFGLQLTRDQILDSMAAQGEVFHNASRFMQNYDLLICPAAIVPPYPVEERYPGFSGDFDSLRQDRRRPAGRPAADRQGARRARAVRLRQLPGTGLRLGSTASDSRRLACDMLRRVGAVSRDCVEYPGLDYNC